MNISAFSKKYGITSKVALGLVWRFLGGICFLGCFFIFWWGGVEGGGLKQKQKKNNAKLLFFVIWAEKSRLFGFSLESVTPPLIPLSLGFSQMLL